MDIIKAMGGGEIISREGVGKISHQTMEHYGIQVFRGTESRRNSHEKDKGVIIGEGRKTQERYIMETTVSTSVVPYAHFKIFTEGLLCAKHLARSLVDLMRSTQRSNAD